jgi:hypothetical protein
MAQYRSLAMTSLLVEADRLNQKGNRGHHFTTCLKCGSRFSEAIPRKAETEYQHNPANPWYGLCSVCERHKGTSRIRLKSSLPKVNDPDPDPTLTDYTRLDGEWREFYEVAYRYAKKVPYEDRPDVLHDIMVELAKARRRDKKPLPELRAYRIASLVIALYWREANKRQVKVCLRSGHPRKPDYKACNFSHKPSKCSECFNLALRPVQSLEGDASDAEGNTGQLKDTIADDNAIDIPAWLDARTWLATAPYRLIEIANKKRRNQPLTHADRLYLSKWRKRAQKALF